MRSSRMKNRRNKSLNKVNSSRVASSRYSVKSEEEDDLPFAVTSQEVKVSMHERVLS